MRVVWDADVILDVLLDRGIEGKASTRLMTWVERGELTGYLAETTVLSLHQAAARVIGADAARGELRKLLLLFDVAPVNRVALESALMNKTLEFEDAVLYEAARHGGAEALVTRSFPAFKGAQVPVVTPEKLLKVLSQKGRSHAPAWG